MVAVVQIADRRKNPRIVVDLQREYWTTKIVSSFLM